MDDTKKYVCYHCDEQLATSIALKQHNEEVHNELKPYKCRICDKKFHCHSHLHLHEMIHRDEKPHQCDLCERSFTQKGNLKRHFEAKHCINKDYKCNVCEKVFENKWSLNIHTATEHFHDIA